MLSTVLRTSRRVATRANVAAFHTTPVTSAKKEEAAPATGFMGTSLSPLYAIPVGITFGIPIIHNEVLILNAETQLVACFAAFVITAYTQGGDAIAKNLDAKAQAMMEEHNKIEDANISAVQAVIDAHKKRLNLLEDLESIAAESKACVSKLEAAKSSELKFAMRDDIESKLINMASREEMILQKISSQLTSNAKAQVTAQFKASDKAKASSLDAALAALNGKPSSTNPVKELYTNYFKDYTKYLTTNAGKVVNLTAEQTAHVNEEIKAIQKKEGLEGVKYVFDGKATI